MNVRSIAEFMMMLSTKKRTILYRIISLLSGSIVFLVVLPAIFIQIGMFIEKELVLSWHPFLNTGLSMISIPFGLIILIWTVIIQWTLGKGTPAPNAPTQKLIVIGPYKYCRNPIELGAIIYYLGVGTYFVSLTTGIVCCGLGLIIGSLYHKFIEEEELELRFGEEYLEYKKRTPFLLPRIRIFS